MAYRTENDTSAWRLALLLLPGTLAVCRLAPDAPIPLWAHGGSFVSITRTRDELSVVCAQSGVPDGVQVVPGWRCLKVEGPFDLDETVGVMAALAAPLAEAGVSIFAVATYDTDYLLLKESSLAQAVDVLTCAGHTVRHSDGE